MSQTWTPAPHEVEELPLSIAIQENGRRVGEPRRTFREWLRSWFRRSA